MFTLPSEIRKTLQIGGRVLLINAGDHVKLIPLSSASFESLSGAIDINKPFK